VIVIYHIVKWKFCNMYWVYSVLIIIFSANVEGTNDLPCIRWCISSIYCGILPVPHSPARERSERLFFFYFVV